MSLNNLKIDPSWTLFLDRDGVINERLPGDYVSRWEQFVFMQGTLDAIQTFSNIFRHIVVVTNQQGIGKGLMKHDDLSGIHRQMKEKIADSGGRIDAVYYSPFLTKENHFTRKPNIGMGLLAKRDFPDIDFKKSIMAGDSISDMKFGKRLKMVTIFIGDVVVARENHRLVDFSFPDLITFANFIQTHLYTKD